MMGIPESTAGKGVALDMQLNRRQFANVLAAAPLMSAASAAEVVSAGAPAASRSWFRDARFGMFIHFGLYSTFERGEWVMHTEGITPAEYQKRIALFNPSKFDARGWVDLAKAAGQRYMTVTSKHHEGFCMFRTATSDFGIAHAPFGRDLIGELAAECHRQNMPLFFYFSLMDWNNPAYQESLKPKTPVSAAFLDVVRTQLRELCTQYGKIAGIWFDGGWDHTAEQWHAAELLSLIRGLQPEALINDRSGLPADFSTPEQELGRRPEKDDGRLREACLTINDDWGYARTDSRYKPAAELIQMLATAAGSDANVLLNVGPQPTGVIQPEFVERLHAVGAWLNRNGTAIYATRPGPGVYYTATASTARATTWFLHIFNWPVGAGLRMDYTVKGQIRRAYVVEDGSPFPFERNAAGGITTTAINKGWSAEDCVIAFETDTGQTA
jgi:alpha-L-fucosidase